MSYYRNREYLEGEDFLFHADLYEIAVGEYVRPHAHEFFEFVYVLEGTGEHLYRESAQPISQGDVFLIEPGLEHAYRVGPRGHMLVYNVLFQPSLLARELQSLSQLDSFVDFFYIAPFYQKSPHFRSHLSLGPQERLEMVHLLDRLVGEYKGKLQGYRFLVQTKLLEIFIFLSRCHDLRQRKPASAFGRDSELLERVCDFIRVHHAQPLTLQQMCRLCGMSTTTFSSKFKEHRGQTFIEYRNAVRIEVATRMLRDTDAKMVQIALDVGFDDVSHFNRLFKQKTGLSPRSYRGRSRL